MFEPKEKYFKDREIAKMTDIEYAEYEDSKKRFNDYRNTVKTAEKKGEKKGIIKGLIEGEAKGEKKKAVESAKEMLADGVSIEKIMKYTGLTIDEIKSLKIFWDGVSNMGSNIQTSDCVGITDAIHLNNLKGVH